MPYDYIYNKYKKMSRFSFSKRPKKEIFILFAVLSVSVVSVLIPVLFSQLISNVFGAVVYSALVVSASILFAVYNKYDRDSEMKRQAERRKERICELISLLKSDKCINSLPGIEMLMRKCESKISSFPLRRIVSKVPVIFASLVAAFNIPDFLAPADSSVSVFSEYLSNILLLAALVTLAYVSWGLLMEGVEATLTGTHSRLRDDLDYIKVQLIQEADGKTAH